MDCLPASSITRYVFYWKAKLAHYYFKDKLMLCITTESPIVCIVGNVAEKDVFIFCLQGRKRHSVYIPPRKKCSCDNWMIEYHCVIEGSSLVLNTVAMEKLPVFR